MNKHNCEINDGLLRLHAKLTALSEIFGASTESDLPFFDTTEGRSYRGHFAEETA